MAQQKLLIETKNKHVTLYSLPSCTLVCYASEPLPTAASEKICNGPYVIDSLLESCILFEQKTAGDWGLLVPTG